MSEDNVLENRTLTEMTEIFMNLKVTQEEQEENSSYPNESAETERQEDPQSSLEPSNEKVHRKTIFVPHAIDFLVEAPFYVKVPVTAEVDNPMKDNSCKDGKIEELEYTQRISNCCDSKKCREKPHVQGEIDILVEALIHLKVPLTLELDVPVEIVRCEDKTSESNLITSSGNEDIKVLDITVNDQQKLTTKENRRL